MAVIDGNRIVVGPTGAAVAGVKEIGGPVAVGETNAGRSFQE